MSRANTPPAYQFTAAEVDDAVGAFTYRLRSCRPRSDIEKEAYNFLAGRGGIRGMRAGYSFSRAHAITLVSSMLERLRAAGASATLCAEMAQELRELWQDPRFR